MTFLETEEIQRIGDAIGLKGRFLVDWGTDDIINTLCPQPEFETVEVKLYTVLGSCLVYATREEAEKRVCQPVIELTGTYQREIKPKAKHREEIHLQSGTLQWDDGTLMTGRHRPCPCDAKFYAEWED